MAGRAVQEMIDEETKPNLTPMIDVVFLLLIFFMLMKFKTYEEKLDSHLPQDEGMMDTDPDVQENLTIQLNPYSEQDPTRIVIQGVNQQGETRITPIPWRGEDRQEGDRTVEAAHPAMFEELESGVFDQLQAGNIDKKVVLAPHPEIPFDYVALTLDAVHKAHEKYIEQHRPGAMAQINEYERKAREAREAGDSPVQHETDRDNFIEELRDQGLWKDVTFEAPEMAPRG